MVFCAFFILFALFLAPIPDPGPEVVAQDTKLIQGTWELVDVVLHGKSVIKDAPPGTNGMVFAGEKMSLTNGQRVEKSFSFKLDQTKKPKAIDLVSEDGPFKGESSPGIYQLNGDRLLLCLPNGPTKDRPTEFAAPENTELVLFTLKRTAK